MKIHRTCQKTIYNDLKRKGTRPTTKLAKIPKVVTRSNVTDFDWTKNCLYCTEKCVDQSKHPNRSKFRKVCTLPFKDSILKVCTERDDEWAADLKFMNFRFHCLHFTPPSLTAIKKRNNTSRVSRHVEVWRQKRKKCLKMFVSKPPSCPIWVNNSYRWK